VSRTRLEEHRRRWREKPVLERVYAPWFEALLAATAPGGRVLEVGAGPGSLAAFAREKRPDLRFFASDLCAAPWNDLAADAGHLPFADGVVQAVVGLDILHHLARPAVFFHEVARVLGDGGRLALVEPWITPFSWLVYRLIHHERCRLSVYPWDPFPGGDKDAFDGDAAVPWRIVRDTDAARWRALGFAPPQRRLVNAFGYLLSLGFRSGSLLPVGAAEAAVALDRWATPLAPLGALRAALTWNRVRA